MSIDKRVSSSDISDECIKRYFKDINNRPQLSDREEKKLIDKIKRGDEDAIKRLIEGNLKFVITIAKKYKGYGLPLIDLINEGNLGLIKAAKKYDPSKGFRFISYAVWWIKQAIKQSLNDNSRTIRYPNSLINKVNKAKKELNIESLDEMRESEDFDSDLPTCVFYNDVVDEDQGNDNLMIEDDSSYEEVRNSVEKNNYNIKKELNKTMSILDDRERDIIEKYYGINTDHEDRMTLEELGEKHGLTKERVRQVKKDAMKKLRYNVGNLHKFME